MSVRMKITRSKTRSRRSHHALSAPATTTTQSGGVRRRHFADPATGMYRGKAVGAKARTLSSPKASSSAKKVKTKKGE